MPRRRGIIGEHMTTTPEAESPDALVPVEAPEVPAGEPKPAHGTFSGMSFGLVVLVALLLIALAIFSSPLLAVIILCIAAVFLLIGMSALRQRSERQDQRQGGSPDTGAPGPGGRRRGASASYEG